MKILDPGNEVSQDPDFYTFPATGNGSQVKKAEDMGVNKRGMVYLVGAGPGDPGLLTLKGKECLSEAEVVVYDYLANSAFLGFCRREAELIYAGKRGGRHTMTQDEISALMVQKAREGKTVVRLKGGDPFIFGRGGEEVQALEKAGVGFEVVPGVTSAIAVPAYAGIPLTHRDYTSTVAFITGHEDPVKKTSSIAWDKLATGAGSLVFLMGVGNLPEIAERLLAEGREPDTPVAVIRRGTSAEQRTVVGPLRDIAGIAEQRGVRPPAVIVVGGVVELREDLAWFEKRPLFGRKIVVTRAREQASEFLEKLNKLGGECVEFPTIEVVPPESWAPLDGGIENLESYNWILFTSVNGVKYFLKRLRHQGKDVRDLKGLKIGAIGPKTAEIWENIGVKVDLVPQEYRAEAIVECFRDLGAQGADILLPRAEKAREILPEELRKMGARVDVVPAYRTIKPDRDLGRVEEMLEQRTVDMVTFTSSSTVTNFVEMFGGRSRRLEQWMKSVAVACIGPITAEKAREKGFSVALIPPEYTIQSLVEAICGHYSSL